MGHNQPTCLVDSKEMDPYEGQEGTLKSALRVCRLKLRAFSMAASLGIPKGPVDTKYHEGPIHETSPNDRKTG